MKFLKELWQNVGTRVWMIVTSILIVSAVLVTSLGMTVFAGAFDEAFGGDRQYVIREGKPAPSDGPEENPGGGDDPEQEEKPEEDLPIVKPHGKLYEPETASKRDAYEKGNLLNEKICEEGFVLLKNDNALPLAPRAKVSVFGKNSVDPIYGITGSDPDNVSFYDSLTAAGITYNGPLKAFYDDPSRSGEGRNKYPTLDGNINKGLNTGETAPNRYDDLAVSEYAKYNDAAIVVFSRIGGESFDLPTRDVVGHSDPNDHYLQLDDNEKLLLSHVSANFDNVIIILNSGNPMELGFLDDPAYRGRIRGCISIGYPGAAGMNALGKILTGEVTPSGRTVDTWAADFNEGPALANFGDNAGRYNSASGEILDHYFTDYEENIYVGYRYYETRFGYDNKLYAEKVVFPFGYGLSYTTFDWEIADSTILHEAISPDRTYTVDVKVTNTGKYKGKDVVQLYCDLPYFAGGIEKSSSVLCGFVKTPLLYPADDAGVGKPNSCIVTLTFDPYYAASYDYADANKNTFKCYELDQGSYSLSVSRNVHYPVEKLPFRVASDIRFETDSVTGLVVENRFGDADAQLESNLSRTNWSGTMPTSPHVRTADETVLSAIEDKTHNNPNICEVFPLTGTDVTVRLYELIGKSYEDPDWDTLLSSLTAKEMKNLFDRGAFGTADILKIGKPRTTAAFGASGFESFFNDNTVYGTVSYANPVVVSSTWNLPLAEEFGRSIGEESLWGDSERRGAGLSYSEWYAPNANIHRSEFGGMNYEYFSEDPFLAGMMAAAEVRGAGSKGVTCFVGNFAINEQESYRSYGISAWLTEQVLREMYLKPFEIAVKEGGARGIMTSYGRIGTRWTGGDYRLLTEVLRAEWGFKGMVVSNYNTVGYMDPVQMLYAGGDLNMSTVINRLPSSFGFSACDVSVLRNAAHNVLYAVANSNSFNEIITVILPESADNPNKTAASEEAPQKDTSEDETVYGYRMAVWKIVIIVLDCLIVTGCAVWGAIAITMFLRSRRK